MRLNELFDNTGQTKWNKPLNPNKGGFYSAFFSVAGRQYSIDFIGNTESGYHLDFQDETDEHAMFHNTGLVGKESYKVFSHVISALKEFVATMLPPKMEFGGWKDDGRDRFYSKLLKYFSDFVEGLGYTVHTEYDDTKLNFTLTRKKAVTEAPLADFGVHGDTMNAGSYSASDVRAFNNEKWLHKVTSHFSRCPINFNVMLYNAPNNRFKWDNTTRRILSFRGVADDDMLKKLNTELGVSLKRDPNAINFLMVDNEGDEKVGLTPWILVHRLVHGMLLAYDANIVAAPMSNFVKKYRPYLSKLLKFKSAQHEDVVREGEYIVELITQYIVQGKITINDWRPDLNPKTITINNFYELRAHLQTNGDPDDTEKYQSTFAITEPHIARMKKLYDKKGTLDEDAYLKGIPEDKQERYKMFFDAYCGSFGTVYGEIRKEMEVIQHLDEDVESLNNTCEFVLKRCVGKFLVLGSNTGRDDDV